MNVRPHGRKQGKQMALSMSIHRCSIVSTASVELCSKIKRDSSESRIGTQGLILESATIDSSPLECRHHRSIVQWKVVGTAWHRLGRAGQRRLAGRTHSGLHRL
jgi:hypothetical protein